MQNLLNPEDVDPWGFDLGACYCLFQHLGVTTFLPAFLPSVKRLHRDRIGIVRQMKIIYFSWRIDFQRVERTLAHIIAARKEAIATEKAFGAGLTIVGHMLIKEVIPRDESAELLLKRIHYASKKLVLDFERLQAVMGLVILLKALILSRYSQLASERRQRKRRRRS